MSNNMDVQAVVTAKTTDFDTKMLKSGQVATATGRAVEKAAKQAAAAQAFADKFIGDSVDARSMRIVKASTLEVEAASDLRKAQALVKQGMFDEAQGAQLVAAALQRSTAAKKANAEASAIQELAQKHSGVSQQMAASAAVRGLEGNAGIRSVERFLTTIPGVGAAMQNLFPLIGGIAFLGIITKIGTELFDTEQKGKHAGEEMSRAFGEMNAKLELSNDELALQNAKLEDVIGKLSGRPTDGLATGLLEAAVAADKFQEALAADVKTLKALLQESNVSVMEGMLSGTANTVGSNKEIDARAKQVEHESLMVKAAYNQAQVDAKGDRAKEEAATKAYYGRLDQIAAEAARNMRQRATEIAVAQKTTTYTDQALVGNSGVKVDATAQRSSFEDAAVVFDNIQRRSQLAGNNFIDQKKKGALEGQKALAEDSSKADEKRLKQMEASLKEMQLLGNDSAKAEFDYWTERIGKFVVGSQQYDAIVSKQAALAERGRTVAAEKIAKEKSSRRGSDSDEGDRSIYDYGKDVTKAAQGQVKAQNERTDMANELAAVNQRNAASLEELSISEAIGQSISRIAGFTELAAVHTRAYGAEIDRLNVKAQQIANDSSLTDAEKEKQLGQVGIQSANLRTSRAHQIVQDRYETTSPASSAGVGAKDALDEFVDSTRDAARMMKQIVDSALSGVNKTLVDDMTGQRKRGEWTSVGRGLATDISGGALRKGEGAVLGAFGLGSGKPDGSAGNPLHVIMANLPGVSMPSIVSSATSSSMSSGPSIKSIGQMLFGMLPGFASGGAISADTMAVIGEKGPELFMPNSGGTIVPNNRLRASAGSGTPSEVHIHQDLRGASDRTMLRAAAKQGAMEGHATMAPHVARMAAGMIQSNRGRRPSSTAR